MRLHKTILENLRDGIAIGPGFPLRHLSSALGRPLHRARMRGYGDVYVRSGSSDAITFRQVFSHRDYGIPASHAGRVDAAYRALCAAGRTPLIVDLGANVGAASIWFAKHYPEAQIVAVEPDPDNAAICRRNVADLSRVEVVEAAVGATPGRVRLLRQAGPDADWGVQTIRDDASAEATRVVTVSELVEADPRRALFIAKIDIEGFESDLFSANTGWLDEVSLVIIEPHDWMLPGRYSSAAFQRTMAAHRFELLISNENLMFIR